MLFHKRLQTVSGCASVTGMLIFSITTAQQTAIAEQATTEQASAEPHAHQHHMM